MPKFLVDFRIAGRCTKVIEADNLTGANMKAEAMCEVGGLQLDEAEVTVNFTCRPMIKVVNDTRDPKVITIG